MSNIDLTSGTASRADLIRDMGTGLLVTSLIGSTISPTTGDYSRGASGFWVENGEILYPVEEITIAGNMAEIFALPAFQSTPAAAAKALISMDGLYLIGFGPRTPAAGRELAAKLYPETVKP